MDKKLNTGVIIVAGGTGKRMGGTVPKQFRVVGGLPLLARSINTFAEALPAARIAVVLPQQYVDFWKNLAARFDVAPHTVTVGGEERFHSVKAGLEVLGEDTGYVAVHDAVRALCTKKLIIRTLQCAMENGSAVPATAPVDSFREVAADGTSKIADRSALRVIQTPQIFEYAALRRAYETEYDPAFTDDASVAERAGIAICLCEGERSNIKITTPEDTAIAEALLEYRNNEDLPL